MKIAVFEALAAAAQANEPVTLGIISRAKGSSPQKAGAKAVFYADGRICGTLGGGCLEAEVQHRAVQALRTGQASTFELLLDHDFGWDDGLVCGGKVEGLILPNAQAIGPGFWQNLAARQTELSWGVADDFSLAQGVGLNPQQILHYRETVRPPCALWIAGAGHIAQAVAPLAIGLDFSVTVFDDRPALVNHRYFPETVELRAEIWAKLLSQPLPAVPAFGLIVTRGHRHDALVLREWIHRPFRFLGMIGSARKARTIFEHFREEKIATPEQLQRVACPVGISIRSRTVQEIAISIVAQLVDKRAALAPEP